MNEKMTGSFLYGNLRAMSVLFRDGPKPYKTLQFTLENGDLINIDIDDLGDPMGVEIVYMNSPSDANAFRFDKKHRVKKEAIVRRLLAACTRLTMINMMQGALTEEINKCLDVVMHSGMYVTTDINKVDGELKVTHDEPKSHAEAFLDESVKIEKGKKE